MDETDLFGSLLGFLENRKVPFCVIGEQAVNAYVEPLVSLDLDIAVALDDPHQLSEALSGSFKVEEHTHSIHLELAGSDFRVQIQTDPRYASFIHASEPRTVLGRSMPVWRMS